MSLLLEFLVKDSSSSHFENPRTQVFLKPLKWSSSLESVWKVRVRILGNYKLYVHVGQLPHAEDCIKEDVNKKTQIKSPPSRLLVFPHRFYCFLCYFTTKATSRLSTLRQPLRYFSFQFDRVRFESELLGCTRGPPSCILRSCDTNEDMTMNSPPPNLSMPLSDERTGLISTPLGHIADIQGLLIPRESFVSAPEKTLKCETTFLHRIDEEAPSHGDFRHYQD
ncbi:hypothetical protein PIB30_048274 [Stylosanthes scabra]|uniref:Uncharacterized protein n=1 Tax=Stylosanthes scabra TaxID=79078 RepID=A0ABU6SHM0_9FABA|nr:hypothetical protein [Stylosanthes scabra]